jgi:hypothetical protein
MTLSRRSLITGLVSLVAAPAIVRVSSLMPVRGVPLDAFRSSSDLFQGEEITWTSVSDYRGAWSMIVYRDNGSGIVGHWKTDIGGVPLRPGEDFTIILEPSK